MASEPVCLCAFCGRNQKQVWKQVAGPGIFLCDACADQLLEIIQMGDEQRGGPPEKRPPDTRAWSCGKCSFCLELKNGDEKIYGSDGFEGVEADAVICRDCLFRLRATFVEEGWGFGDPDGWYSPLRSALREYVWQPGQPQKYTPEELKQLGQELAASAPKLFAEVDWTINEPYRTRGLRRLFARALEQLVNERGRSILFADAIALGEEWLRLGEPRRVAAERAIRKQRANPDDAPAGRAGLPVPPEETADTDGDGGWKSALRPLSEWICSPGSRNACSPEEIEELSAELALEGPARFKAFFDSQYDNPDARERFQMTKLKDLFAEVLKERLLARKRSIAFDDAVQLGEEWIPLGARLFLEYAPEERSVAGAFGTNIRRGDPDGICLFCGGPERQRPAMISVGTGTACGKCIDVCNEQFLVVLEREKAGIAPPADPDAAATRCSFCGEKPRERCFGTRSILKSGPTPAICEGCLDRFNELALADLEDLEEPE